MAWKKDIPLKIERKGITMETPSWINELKIERDRLLENSLNKATNEILKEIEKDLKEPEIPIRTDYTKQHNPEYREKMLFRYAYLFNKPESEMMPLELALKWFLKFKGYNSLHEDDNGIEIRRKKSIENDCDAILQSYKIPINLIEDYALIEKGQDRRIILKKVGGSIYD